MAAGGDVVGAGALTLTATYNSIGVELLFGGDADGDSAAALEFKRVADSTWRSGLPLWRTADATGSGPAFYGSALLVDAGTDYDVRVTLQDPDGVAGSAVGAAVVLGQVQTRTDAVVDARQLAPTHYVRVGGSDTNSGTSAGAAWGTLAKAFAAAPAGAVVQVGPGYFQSPASPRRTALTLVAQYPAVDDARAVINPGQHSVVEPGAVAGPRGATDAPHAGVWQQVTLSGPGNGGAPAGASYTVWKWAGSPVRDATQLGVATTRDGAPQRVANWAAKGPSLATPAGWAELLYTNKSYNYGFYVPNGSADVYVRLHGDVDPNTRYVTAGTGVGLSLDGPQIRVSGLEVRQRNVGIQFGANATFGLVDHTLLVGNQLGVNFAARQPSGYGSDHVVQYNRVVDANLWTSDHVAAPAIPWTFIKMYVKQANGSDYGANRVGERSESSAVSGRGGARRVVVRHNTFDGSFNGVSPGYQPSYDRYAGQDMDVHDNLLRRIADDAFEPENQAINFRVWHNRVEDTAVVFSTGPVTFGPLYLFRNEAWRIGNAGVGRENAGTFGGSSLMFKYSGNSTPAARVYVVNNTFVADPQSPDVSGGDQFAGGGSSPERFWLRNNIIVATRYAFRAPVAPGAWDEDYNHFSTSDAARGLRYNATYTTNVTAYRNASGQGAHTNVTGSFVALPALVDRVAGNLRLASGSPLTDLGTVVPNIADQPGRDYTGAAPDLGATER